MANPLTGENKIYEQIRNENITVHPLVWKLLNHYIRNDLNKISTGIGTLLFMPVWILKSASVVITLLYRISFQPGDPPVGLKKICETSLDGAKSIKEFLAKLRDATCER